MGDPTTNYRLRELEQAIHQNTRALQHFTDATLKLAASVNALPRQEAFSEALDVLREIAVALTTISVTTGSGWIERTEQR